MNRMQPQSTHAVDIPWIRAGHLHKQWKQDTSGRNMIDSFPTLDPDVVQADVVATVLACSTSDCNQAVQQSVQFAIDPTSTARSINSNVLTGEGKRFENGRKG